MALFIPDVTTPQKLHIRPDEAGFILPLVLIIVAIGAMVVIGLVGYASGLFRAGGNDTDALRELYAADAGVAHVKSLLEQGAKTGNIPPIEVNGIQVTMNVTPIASLEESVPPPLPVPIDPALPTVLSEPHSVPLHSVPEGATASIFWVFTAPSTAPTPPNDDPNTSGSPTPTPTPEPALPSISITVDDGSETAIATSVPLRSLSEGEGENFVRLEEVELPDQGTYIVTFDPGTTVGLESVEFTEDSEDCGKRLNPNLCLTASPTDFIVISRAGQTTVTAYLRQLPHWQQSFSGGINYTYTGGLVDTLSWKPYPPDK